MKRTHLTFIVTTIALFVSLFSMTKSIASQGCDVMDIYLSNQTDQDIEIQASQTMMPHEGAMRTTISSKTALFIGAANNAHKDNTATAFMRIFSSNVAIATLAAQQQPMGQPTINEMPLNTDSINFNVSGKKGICSATEPSPGYLVITLENKPLTTDLASLVRNAKIMNPNRILASVTSADSN